RDFVSLDGARSRPDAGFRVADTALVFLRGRDVRCDGLPDQFDSAGPRNSWHGSSDLFRSGLAGRSVETVGRRWRRGRVVLDPHWAGHCLYRVGDSSFQTLGESHTRRALGALRAQTHRSEALIEHSLTFTVHVI